jgi:hypothetical protein
MLYKMHEEPGKGIELLEQALQKLDQLKYRFKGDIEFAKIYVTVKLNLGALYTDVGEYGRGAGYIDKSLKGALCLYPPEIL